MIDAAAAADAPVADAATTYLVGEVAAAVLICSAAAPACQQ
jgi:hypothetical protein